MENHQFNILILEIIYIYIYILFLYVCIYARVVQMGQLSIAMLVCWTAWSSPPDTAPRGRSVSNGSVGNLKHLRRIVLYGWLKKLLQLDVISMFYPPLFVRQDQGFMQWGPRLELCSEMMIRKSEISWSEMEMMCPLQRPIVWLFVSGDRNSRLHGNIMTILTPK